MKNKYTLILVVCEEFIDEKKTEKFFEFLNKVAPGNEAQKTFKENTIMFWTYELDPVVFWKLLLINSYGLTHFDVEKFGEPNDKTRVSENNPQFIELIDGISFIK